MSKLRLITRAARPTTMFDSTDGFSGFFQLSSVVRFRQWPEQRSLWMEPACSLCSRLSLR